MRLRFSYIALWAPLLLALVMNACSFNAARRARVSAKEGERISELTQAAHVANVIGRESLVRTNYGKALIAYDLSDDFLRRDQSLVGLPIQDQTEQVRALLSENEELRSDALAAERKRQAQEESWRADKAKYEAALLEMGQKYEAEHNKSIVRRIFASLGIGGTIAAIVAICIFFPAAIPLFTHFAGWIVSKVPAMASGLGVVSKKAFDQVVSGVECAKAELRKNPKNTEAVQVLDAGLSRSIDEQHKVLIRARKAKIRVPLST